MRFQGADLGPRETDGATGVRGASNFAGRKAFPYTCSAPKGDCNQRSDPTLILIRDGAALGCGPWSEAPSAV